ncbi:hypothetical protein [Gilvibacter sp.]|uniref:hypothetical protein n=1 Tax=Gilvibacter sp. TaxID=2729997 RepID=UPI0025BEB545|nr:hypothetical protein [Gilvibacter sp.]NQX77304.1 hypothetical protein [Gilvibacter sp.]
MKKYKKKPVVIDAILWDGTKECYDALASGSERSLRLEKGQLVIKTLEGEMRAPVGHYIIKGIKGEFYPCDPEIFAQTYESVD